MRNQFSSWLFLVIFSANCFGIYVVLVSGKCQDDQQSMLLQIKSSLIFEAGFYGKLVQWVPNTDCCRWGGVDCDVAGHVVGLDLSSNYISGGIENATDLFNLPYLKRLNLAYNRFKTTQIPGRLAHLKNLTYLNLSNAGFEGQIPLEISKMTRLVILDLSSDLIYFNPHRLKLENPRLSVLVQNLTELRELYLDGVNISTSGNEWFQASSYMLSNLRILSLSTCFLSGPIDSSLKNLRSLAVIRLKENNLSSPVPDFLADFKYLTSVELSNCGLSGTFPEKILQVPTLRILDLSRNQLLEGSLPDFPENIHLQTLLLHDTNWSGMLPDSIGNRKNLSKMDLSYCHFSGPIPTSVANLTQLEYLDLSSNNFSGPVPSFHMSKDLTFIDLSHNDLTGAISSTNWEQLLNLSYLNLMNNSLDGKIPPSLFAMVSLQYLYLSINQFEGQVPEFSGASSSVLEVLDLSENKLEGSIPMSVFDIEDLDVLDLHFNKFNGTVQLSKIQRPSYLSLLDLSHNCLTVDASY